MTAALPDVLRVETITSPVDATVHIAGSKSIANRALVCAALADGRSTVTNVPTGDDTAAMLACLAALGVPHSERDGTVTLDGRARLSPEPGTVLFAALAGTTSRFIAALAATAEVPLVVDGLPPLQARPFGPLFEALRQLGVDVSAAIRPTGLPVTITGPPTTGSVRMPGDVSSQFISALMLIAPTLPDGLRIELTTPLVSRPYVDLTVATMAAFGVTRVEVGDRSITVTAGRYEPTRLAIEPDASSASYPLAVAALVGGTVTVPGLGEGALHGDARFADVLSDMGCSVHRTGDAVSVSRDPQARLAGVDIDMADISDLVPTLAVVAACASTPTRITGVGFIRGKESDRLGDLAAELRKLGVDIDVLADGLSIRPSLATLRGGRVGTHHDHRLAMAFGVLGCVVDGIDVEAPDVVSKSWPEFWTVLDGLRR